ncbi:hypothetical protein [Methanobrevibacter gottschalkii]|nr:hypothetical protein [Methanobrevibacter gottschalkii]
MNKLSVFIVIIIIALSISSVCAGDSDHNKTDDSILGEADTSTSSNITRIGVNSIYDDGVNETIKTNSSFVSSNVVTYETFSTKITVRLLSNNNPLNGKNIIISVGNVSYNKTTDANGKVVLNVKLAKGKYNAMFSYGGDENINPCQKTTTVIVKTFIKTKIYCADKNINYRQGLKNTFIVRLIDGNGKALKSQTVTFKVNGKMYIAKTDKKGYAEVCLNLKKGLSLSDFHFIKNHRIHILTDLIK